MGQARATFGGRADWSEAEIARAKRRAYARPNRARGWEALGESLGKRNAQRQRRRAAPDGASCEKHPRVRPNLVVDPSGAARRRLGLGGFGGNLALRGNAGKAQQAQAKRGLGGAKAASEIRPRFAFSGTISHLNRGLGRSPIASHLRARRPRQFESGSVDLKMRRGRRSRRCGVRRRSTRSSDARCRSNARRRGCGPRTSGTTCPPSRTRRTAGTSRTGRTC